MAGAVAGAVVGGGVCDEESVESCDESAESVSFVGVSGAGGVHGGTPANSR